MASMFNLKYLSILALTLAFLVVGMGAYTRLTEAGLGCPDWPGCYGHHSVPNSPDEIQKAIAAFPDVPLEPHKAWNEMIHRYLEMVHFAGFFEYKFIATKSCQFYRRRDQI